MLSLHLYGMYLQYNQFKTPMENIGLQDSLLSRFDLLFIVLDKVCWGIVSVMPVQLTYWIILYLHVIATNNVLALFSNVYSIAELIILLFQMDPESDRQISDHVLRMHLFRSAGEQDGDGKQNQLVLKRLVCYSFDFVFPKIKMQYQFILLTKSFYIS